MIQFDGLSAVRALAYSPDSSLLAVATAAGQVLLYNAYGEVLHSFETSPIRDYCAICWPSSGQKFIVGHARSFQVCTLDGQVTNLSTNASVEPNITALALVTDDLLAVGTSTHLQLYQFSTKRYVPGGHVEPQGVHGLSAHKATKQLAWTTGEHRLRTWKMTSPDKHDIPLGKHSGAVAIHPQGNQLAVAVDWKVLVFNLGVKRPNHELVAHKGRVTGLAYSADGRTLASCGWDNTVRLWSVATREEQFRFPLQLGPLSTLCISPDGTRFAVAGSDGPLVILDTE